MNLLEVGLEKLRSVLGTDLERGLTSEQVLRNRKEFGENILFEKKNTVLDLLKKIFGDILMVLFLLAGVFDYLETGDAASLFAAISVAVLYAGFVLWSHLYVKKVNGILADFDKDQTYWGFYQNGEYLLTGVDTTAIVGGEHFEIVYSR